MEFKPDGDLAFQLKSMLNSGLRFDDNFDSALVEFETKGEPQSLQHGLGNIPTGYIVVYKSDNVEIFGHEEVKWTSEQLKVNSTEAGVTVRMQVL